MSIRKMTLAVTMSLCILPIGSALWAEEADEADITYKDYKIDEMTCREMLKMGGTERDFTMIFLHGFMSGKKSQLLFEPGPLAEASDKVLDQCINNPDAKLLAVFEKARG